MPTALFCDLCGQGSLAFAHEPEGGARGLKVYLCQHCGLVQSLPRIDRTPTRHAPSVSGGADWGNVRYGKGFRTATALAALSRHASLDGEIALLDVGSNRGSFAAAFLERAPQARITAVEPDERHAASVGHLPRTELITARIEDVALESGRFDIVHSCHTIEHLAHPFESLKDHARVLKDGGLLVLDAPNIALIGADDILEEWFIDKHLYHFSARTLSRMIEAAGFTILAQPDADDSINLLFVAQKTGAAGDASAADPGEAAAAQRLLSCYAAMRARNRAALAAAAREIEGLAPRRVALWGAGRLFDSLVLHGGFDPQCLALLIDAHLALHMDARHGVALATPQALAGTRVDFIVVMSRGFAAEIRNQAHILCPRAEIILYADLLARAVSARAAA